MVAFLPAPMFKIYGSPRYQDRRNYQQPGRNPKPISHRIVVRDSNGIGDTSRLAVAFRFDPQKIMSGRNARNNYGIATITLRPGTVRIVTGVVADLSSKIVGLSSVFTHQRVIQVEPVVVQIRVAFYFYRDCPAARELDWFC